jgi:GxxExxY protein
MEENEISFYIRKAIFKTYNTFGPGLLESVYEKVLKIEIEKNGLKVQSHIPINVIYESQVLDIGFRADLLVEDKVIIEIKSVEEISPVHHKQLLTYLKLTNRKLGILVNFNTDYIDKSIFRKVNNL